jgi:hypothetical protein
MVGSTDLRVLEYILGAWRGLGTAARPPYLWLCLHAPLEVGAEPLVASIPILAVWFADRWRIRAESAWTYLRFHTMHQVQPWCSLTTGERTDVFGGKGPHRIGLAAFASYEERAAYWVAVTWGGLHGEGLQVSVEPHGEVRVQKKLWIS